jgi:hypothetical protein
MDKRRSFPELELGEEHVRRQSIDASFNADIVSPILTSSERWFFYEQDGDSLSIRQSFPATLLQDTNISWPDPMDNSDHQSPPLLNWEMSDERRSFPTSETTRRNILSPASPEFVGPEQTFDSEVPQSPTTGTQSISRGNLAERRSFPALKQPGIELREARRSFPVPESHVATNTLESLSRLTNGEAVVRDRQVVFAFEEYNGMTKKKKLTHNMERYLEE